MSPRQEDILIELMAECADQIMAGASVTACLERYPEQAEALRPLLVTMGEVRRLRAIPERPVAIARQRRAQFVAAAQAFQPAPQPLIDPLAALGAWWTRLANWLVGPPPNRRLAGPMPAGLLAMLAIVVITGIMLTGIISVSAEALPGDTLYPVKLSVEQVQLLFTFDSQARVQLLDRMAERRVSEAQAVIELKRRVVSLPLDGQILEIQGNTWVVSGLRVTLTPDSQVIGTPVVGARVQGRVSAPGDGSLVVRYVEIEPLLEINPVAPPTPSPLPTAPAKPPTPTPTATDEGPAALTNSPIAGFNRAPMAFDEPTDPPTPTPTATHTPTATRTATATQTPTATATFTPVPPREQLKGFVFGYVERIEGSRWTINGVTVETNAATQFIGNPQIGSRVQVIVEIKPDGAYIALSIAELAPPGEPPVPFQFTGAVHAISGSIWTIDDYQVLVTAGATVLENDPGIGDEVEVKAERHASGEIHALRIIAIRGIDVYFDGIIEAKNGDVWQIGGYAVLVNAKTTIIGDAVLGAKAQVAAEEMPDGRLIAKIISVTAPPPTATVTPTATPEASATPTPTPEVTNTPTPEATATPTLTATVSVASTATATPIPEPSVTPTPEVTDAPMPTDTPTP